MARVSKKVVKKMLRKSPEEEGAANAASNIPRGEPEAYESAPTGSQPTESMQLEPPKHPVETRDEDPSPRPGPAQPALKAGSAGTINIAKLQAMSMVDLNNMAKDLGVENFGTMRK